jgi:hypothetical protein
MIPRVRHEAVGGWVSDDARLMVTGSGALRVSVFYYKKTYPWGETHFGTNDCEIFRFDFAAATKAEWRNLKKFLLWLCAGVSGSLGVSLYKDFRRLMFESREKDWEDVNPPQIVRWAEGEFARAQRGLDCCDNFRLALASSSAQKRRYRRAQKRGCCGSSDWEAIGPDGKRYLLGFNYGH